MSDVVKLNYGDVLVCDPCYIKRVGSVENPRFDALKLVKVLHEGGDGDFKLCYKDYCVEILGVDSGRIWAMQAEFDIEVEIDAGFSGYKIARKNDNIDLDKVYVNETESEGDYEEDEQ